MNIDHDIETTPLEIRSDSVLGSGDEVYVYFRDSQGNWAGGVNLELSSTPQYYIGWCNGSFYFPTTLPTATVKVWRITVIKSSDIVSVQIHCNEKEVLNYLLSDSTCWYDWTTFWSRDGAQIYFLPGYTTASDYYRPYSSGNYNYNFMGVRQSFKRRNFSGLVRIRRGSFWIQLGSIWRFNRN